MKVQSEDEARIAYDLVAEGYAALLDGELERLPLERAMLTAFLEQVEAGGGGPIADLGCGPGRVAGFLAGIGADMRGIDLSPGMIAVARRDHPAIPFEVASMAELPFGDGELAGALAWYSIIHVPQDLQDAVFAEFARALRPGGMLLLAFQVSEDGDEDIVHLRQAYGHEIDLRTRRQSPARVERRLAEAGFAQLAQLVREPIASEKSRQAFLLARRCVPAQRMAGSGSAAS
ncbi:class I SAM-dependent DNA methyltransferase [Leifsonia shinshuensis]|uniref:class I SAM-dependent DNA methyltransferase n=1 Tax=Leifsonia shinshuensis TaxID=150026 RepID=UPI001F50DF7B|nr:class I SAM-dependent methyltransferase [Leifsonia shinshuensis]